MMFYTQNTAKSANFGMRIAVILEKEYIFAR